MAAKTATAVKKNRELSEEEILKAPEKDYMNEAQLAFFKKRLLDIRDFTSGIVRCEHRSVCIGRAGRVVKLYISTEEADETAGVLVDTAREVPGPQRLKPARVHNRRCGCITRPKSADELHAQRPADEAVVEAALVDVGRIDD